MQPPTQISLQTGIDVRHHALLLILSNHPYMSNLHKVYVTSAFGSVDLKISMSNHVGARCFSFCLLLLQHLPLGASLTVEYPSESAPPFLGEDGGKFPGHSFAGWLLWSVHTLCLPQDLSLQWWGGGTSHQWQGGI